MCRFSDAWMRTSRRALTAGVWKAPRHEIAGGERRGGSRLWGISLDADSSDRGFWGEEMAGRSGGMVREAVWKAGKRVERLLDVCFGAWVKGDKTSGVAAGR